MPFPAVILWGAAALVAGVGLKKGFDAKENFSLAKSIGENAESKYNNAKDSLEKARKSTQQSLESLGKLKVSVFTNQINHLVQVLQKVRNSSHSSLYNHDINVQFESLGEMEELVQSSLEIEKGLVSGAVTGSLAALGAYGSVGMLATASTGTAIGTLSGAAATNATLAWLGGGALSAGGFGIAGGMIALGGIVLGPALAVGGFLMAGKAEEAVTKAEAYRAEIDKAVEQMKTSETALKAIRTTVAEQSATIQQLVERFDAVKVDNDEDINSFTSMAIIGKHLATILRTPVLTEGVANPDMKVICSNCLLEIGNNQHNDSVQNNTLSANERLLIACRSGDIQEVQNSLKDGADVNIKDINGFTALIEATRKGHKEIVEILLKNGANINEKDRCGWDAMKYASITHHNDVVDVLAQYL